jgi:predicted transcriptional regulator of viral defense system
VGIRVSRRPVGVSCLDESALVQRLGYLVELHRVEVPAERRAELESLVRPGSRIHLGPRARWGTSGQLVSPWNVIENVPREELLAGDVHVDLVPSSSGLGG